MIHKFETYEGEVELPAKWKVCSACQGSGTELAGPYKGMAFSADDVPEGYCESFCDIPCSECGGRTTVPVMDVERMTFAQKRIAVVVRQDARAKREHENEMAHYASLRAQGIEY